MLAPGGGKESPAALVKLDPLSLHSSLEAPHAILISMYGCISLTYVCSMALHSVYIYIDTDHDGLRFGKWQRVLHDPPEIPEPRVVMRSASYGTDLNSPGACSEGLNSIFSRS